MRRYHLWLGWLYQYVFWAAFVVFGWYFLGKGWGPTLPFWHDQGAREAAFPTQADHYSKLWK